MRTGSVCDGEEDEPVNNLELVYIRAEVWAWGLGGLSNVNVTSCTRV
jgi:hypothetical protein